MDSDRVILNLIARQLPMEERSVLKKTTKNTHDKDIIILVADKGNATVVMNTSVYKQKIEDLLVPLSYKKLSHNCTSRLLRKTNELIRVSSIPVDTKKIPPKIRIISPYPLRKAKNSQSWHTTSVNCACAKVSNNNYSRNTYMKDSAHFIEKIKTISVHSFGYFS